MATTQFKKGQIPWNKGKKYSISDEWKDNISKAMKTQWANGTREISESFTNLGNKHSLESRKKISLAKQGKFIGEDNPNWKGGYGDKDYRERRRFRSMMQKQVFERDDYTCQLCGVRGGDIQVDHIQAWADYVEQRFNLDNCRTLCAKCHYRITFGKPLPDNIKGWGHNLLKRKEDL